MNTELRIRTGADEVINVKHLLSFNELIRNMICKMDVKIKINKIKTKLLKILNTLKSKKVLITKKLI